MIRLSRLAVAVAVFAVVCESAAAQKAALSVPRGHALLVGCTRYPALQGRYQLEGPGNDVELMSELLTKRFHFAPGTIVVLSEKQAERRGKNFLPTRANIEREFGALAKKAE